MSIQALRGTDQVFLAEIHALRPTRARSSARPTCCALSPTRVIVSSHLDDPTQVQDAYSLRCAPQVHGAARDTFGFATHVADVELASAIDNPSVLADGTLASNGNFHGAPVGYALDFLAIASPTSPRCPSVAPTGCSTSSRSFGLPPFLAGQPGVDSGLMIAQYTQAALVSEMKRLATPASVDSIPSSGMQEDHVSMGWHAARKLRTSLDAFADVLAIELLTAARAPWRCASRSPPSPATAAVSHRVNAVTGGPGHDRWLSPEIAAVGELVRSGELLDIAVAHVALS